MTAPICRLTLSSPDATAQLARRFASVLAPGDVILLDGPIGSGKTHFARALIQARLIADGAPMEDVPSPTFTLVQSYETPRCEIWHADLYRLTHPDEVEELGLIQAFDEAICLVEWPDRLGDLIPQGALTMIFDATDDPEARQLSLLGDPARWASICETISGEFALDD